VPARYDVPVRRLLPALALLVATTPGLARAEAARGPETNFWAEMATPGLSEYRVLVAGAQERIRSADHEGALVSLRRATALLPDEAPAHLWSAYCLTMVERHDEALVHWERAVALDSTVLDEETLAFRFTITLARVSRYRQAADLYGQMLARGVSAGLRPIVLLNMADMVVAASCEGLDEAIELYEECARDYPDMASGHWGLAAALFRAGRQEEATREMETAARLDPQWRAVNGQDVFFVPDFEVHLYRALGWQQRDNPGQARLEWDAYLDGGGAEGCWPEASRQAREALDRPTPRRGR